MVSQIPTVLRSMSLVLMVLAIEAWVSPCRVLGHLVWPFRLVFYLLENSVHWFSKHSINHLGVGRSWWSDVIFPRSNGIKLVRPEIPPLVRDNLRFTFSLLLIFLKPLVFINLVHKLAHGGNRFSSQGFLNPCSLGRPNLNVLMTTFSKSPSISLYIS